MSQENESGAVVRRSGLHPAVIALVTAAIAASGFAVWSMTRAPSMPAASSVAPMAMNAASQGVSAPPAQYEAPRSVAPVPQERAPHDGAPSHRARSAPRSSASPQHLAAGPAVCRECGRVESVRAVEKQGEGTGLGAVAGGVVGGVVGHQFGGGSGRDLATVAGVAGGAFAGHQVEKRARSTKVWNVTVRMDDGSVRTFTQSAAPAWQQGQPVRVMDGRLVSDAYGPAKPTTVRGG